MQVTMLVDVIDKAESAYPGLRSTTYGRVSKAILADIVSGAFAPGARLKIADLCKRYGLSPMPIREALQQLQGEGFVVISPNRGASVRTLDLKFITDVHDMRGALYTIIYRDAVLNADAAFDAAIARIQEQFDARLAEGDVRGAQEMNRALHATIEAKCMNDEVTRLSARYANMTSALRDVFGYNVGRMREVSKEHWRIVKAIHARDISEAVAAAQHHVVQALANISKNFDEARTDA